MSLWSSMCNVWQIIERRFEKQVFRNSNLRTEKSPHKTEKIGDNLPTRKQLPKFAASTFSPVLPLPPKLTFWALQTLKFPKQTVLLLSKVALLIKMYRKISKCLWPPHSKHVFIVNKHQTRQAYRAPTSPWLCILETRDVSTPASCSGEANPEVCLAGIIALPTARYWPLLYKTFEMESPFIHFK